MSAPQSGLILCQNTLANTDDAYFLKKGEAIISPIIDTPLIVAPVGLASTDLETRAFIGIEGNPASEYQGAINFTTGINANLDAPARDALTLVSQTSGTLAYVGADDTNGNVLAVNGIQGLSQVNDGIYNPTIKSTAIFDETFTLDSSAPATAVHQIPFTITRAGAYMLQIDINFANADSVPQAIVPVFNTAVPPAIIGGYNSPAGALEWTITAPEVQYMSSTITATSLIKANALDGVADPMDFSISNMGFLNAGAYQFNMYALKPVAGPNASGNWILSSVKARVVQMC